MININFSRVLPKIPRRILRQSTFKKLGIFILFKKIEFSLGGGGARSIQSDVWLPNMACLLLMRTSFSVTRPCMFRRKRRYFKHVYQISLKIKNNQGQLH